MLIVCPSCASEYTIDPTKLGADGRTVRCALCRDTWAATPEGGAPAAQPVEGAVLLRAATKPHARPRTARRRAILAAAAACLPALAWPALQGGMPVIGPALLRDALLGPDRPSFRYVTSDVVGPSGGRALVVSGEIVNDTRSAVELSPLEFLVRSGDEQVLATWTSAPPVAKLKPGEAARFEGRLPVPPAEGREVRVRFTKAGGLAFLALTDSR
jgi:predicted Zn finger-like uncharacterized protein